MTSSLSATRGGQRSAKLLARQLLNQIVTRVARSTVCCQKSWRAITLLAVIAAAVPSSVLAQCTGADAWDTRVATGGWADGAGGAYVRAYGSTGKADGDPCHATVHVEVWLNPGGAPTVQNAPVLQMRMLLGPEISGACGSVPTSIGTSTTNTTPIHSAVTVTGNFSVRRTNR